MKVVQPQSILDQYRQDKEYRSVVDFLQSLKRNKGKGHAIKVLGDTLALTRKAFEDPDPNKLFDTEPDDYEIAWDQLKYHIIELCKHQSASICYKSTQLMATACSKVLWGRSRAKAILLHVPSPAPSTHSTSITRPSHPDIPKSKAAHLKPERM